MMWQNHLLIHFSQISMGCIISLLMGYGWVIDIPNSQIRLEPRSTPYLSQPTLMPKQFQMLKTYIISSGNIGWTDLTDHRS